MSFTKSTALILTLVAALAACAQAATTRFYTLNNPTQHQPAAISKTMPIAIEILPVRVPERLKRPQLVLTSKETSQLKILEQDRWSSSFDDELHDAFVAGITNQLGAIEISHSRRLANQPTYRIAIALQQFNATLGEQVQTNFAWTITRLNTDSSTADNSALSCQTIFSKAVSNDIDAIIKGVGEAVAEATQAISTNVSSLNNGELGKCL
ncbi:membrane integrity-associated transporter subunit PqiC [Methylotenera sp.]|uniref:PqiC family protein n=1 Tax=Methylotenera sp. TaxID=2051956 RepID=UPI0024870209|nr:PqiC family protein [Methylotenera sp.]MDI1299823.1 PqiC family protein [Methylotenera sp.]